MLNTTENKYTWAALRERVEKVNPSLARLIDALSLDKSLTFKIESYPYGEIITQGAGTPGLVLNGCIENVIENSRQLIMQDILMPGQLHGDFQAHPGLAGTTTLPFTQYSGARSVFILPNIGNFSCHENLQRDYGIDCPAPKHLSEHGPLFKTIAQHAAPKWRTDILRFPKKVLSKLQSQEPAWQAFHQTLLAPVWLNAKVALAEQHWHYVLSRIQAERHLKPNPFLIDTLHHLFGLITAHRPAFAPANDESTLPLKAIQKAYIESYGLETYAPTIMVPTFVSDKPIYYSLQLPTGLRFSPKASAKASLSSQLRELAHLWNVIKKELIKHKGYGETQLSTALNNTSIRLFHVKAEPSINIEAMNTLASDDPRLTQTKLSEHKTFPASSGFLKACIQIRQRH